ncbi:ribonuclease H-like domain-containing protein [Tanacetum coccineum]
MRPTAPSVPFFEIERLAAHKLFVATFSCYKSFSFSDVPIVVYTSRPFKIVIKGISLGGGVDGIRNCATDFYLMDCHRYVVPTGKDNFIVSAGRPNMVPAGRTIVSPGSIIFGPGKTTVLLSIPDDHVADFHYMDDHGIYGMQSMARRLALKNQRWLELLLLMICTQVEDSEIDNQWIFTHSSSQSPAILHFSKARSHSSGNVLQDVLHSLVAESEPEQQVAYEDFEQIDKLDLEEMDIKWQMAMLSVRVNKFEKKVGRKIEFDKKEAARNLGKRRLIINALITVDTIGEFTEEHEFWGWMRILLPKKFASWSMTSEVCKADSMKVVASPLLGLLSIDHIDLDESQMSYGTKSSTSGDSNSVSNDFVSCDNSDKSSEVNTNDFASSDSSVKSSEPKSNDSTSCASTSSVSTSESEADIEHCHFRKNNSSASKSCFVCGSYLHLIKDCNYYETQYANDFDGVGYPQRNHWDNVLKSLVNQFVHKQYSQALRYVVEDILLSYSGGGKVVLGSHIEIKFTGVPKNNVDLHISTWPIFLRSKADPRASAFGGGEGRITGKGTIRTPKRIEFSSQTTDCLVLSNDFKLLDESMVLLRASNTSHYKAITAVSSISEPLQLLYMDLFGPTSIRSIDSNIMLKTSCIKKVKAIRCDNGAEFKNAKMIELCGEKGIKRDYSNARTPQQNGVAERKNRTLIEAARTINRAYRVYHMANKRVEETMNLRFLEEKANIQGISHEYTKMFLLTLQVSTAEPKDTSDAPVMSKLFLVPSYLQQELTGERSRTRRRKETTYDAERLGWLKVSVLLVGVPVPSGSPTDSFFDVEPTTLILQSIWTLEIMYTHLAVRVEILKQTKASSSLSITSYGYCLKIISSGWSLVLAVLG